MKILLVVPPSYRFGGSDGEVFHLGLGYIAAVLREEGHVVSIYDTNIICEPNKKVNQEEIDLGTGPFERYEAALRDPKHPVWLEVEQVVREFAPEILGITCKVPDLKAASLIARIAKSIDSQCVTIAGGPAATTSTEMVIRDPSFDFAVRGEGEHTIRELLFALSERRSDFQHIDGISFQGSNGIIHNKNRPLIENIDALPFPARDLLMFADCLPPNRLRRIMGGMITSRGCPYSCTYCANHAVWGTRRVRMRSPGSVLAELLHLKEKYGVHDVIFWDDHLTTKKERTEALCHLMIEKKLNIRWLSFARANTINSDILRLMKKAGCVELQIGVESGSERILKMIKKGVTLDQMRNAAKLLRESGIRWHMFLMLGFPSETSEEMQATMRLLDELRPDSVLLSVVTPYPGTEIFEEAQRQGILKGDEWLSADTFNPQSVLVNTMPQEEFESKVIHYMKECYKYNQRGAFISRIKNFAKRLIQRFLALHTAFSRAYSKSQTK